MPSDQRHLLNHRRIARHSRASTRGGAETGFSVGARLRRAIAAVDRPAQPGSYKSFHTPRRFSPYTSRLTPPLARAWRRPL